MCKRWDTPEYFDCTGYGLLDSAGLAPHGLCRLSASLSSTRVIFVFPWRSFTISSPSEEIVMPDQPSYRSQVLDHLGLVAGMFDELGIGDVLDQATHQNPEMW